MMDAGDFSFSFKCDWCDFSTKNILEIKGHVDSHKKIVDVMQDESDTDEVSVENALTEKRKGSKSNMQAKVEEEDGEVADDEEDDEEDEEEEEEEEEEDVSSDEGTNREKDDNDAQNSDKEYSEEEEDEEDCNEETYSRPQCSTSEHLTDNSLEVSFGNQDENLQKKARRKPPIPKKAIKEVVEMTNEAWEQEERDLAGEDESAEPEIHNNDSDYEPGNIRITRAAPIVTRSRDEQLMIHQFTEGQDADVIEKPCKTKYMLNNPKHSHKCKICSFTCKFKSNLIKHKRSHEKKNSDSGQKSSASRSNKKPTVAENRYRCNQCDYTCKFKYRLKDHKASQHKVDKPSDEKKKKMYVCDICGHIALNKYKISRHIRKHTGEKPFKCEECAMCFSERGNLLKHQGRHTLEKNFLCEECGKAFKRDINLRMHRRIHKTENLYECVNCDYKCVRKDMLESHRARKHLKMKALLCDHCGKGFYTKQELESHRRNKHAPRNMPHRCILCDLSFITEYKLKAHLKTHPEYKPFKCDFCGVLFRKSASLIYHRRVHTGEKPLQCELCTYVTSTPSNMYKHRKREHGITRSAQPSAKRGRKRSGQNASHLEIGDVKLVLEMPARVPFQVDATSPPVTSQPVSTMSTVTSLPSSDTDNVYADYHYTQAAIQHHQPQHPQSHLQPPQSQIHPGTLQPITDPHGIPHPSSQDVIGSYTVPPVHQVHQLLFHQ
ncbi:uncharacterized protein LOC100367368 [Saccoglossus kowalevskii]|uniref:Zinc finger protein 267-like n=1 Tax=Saccoglossus kowalevskii TaxID=10224 RepID=A0ABM0GRE4_SACKO|nr:PREDICTED: zinc finger protein 267-like [Saccoglossus kowalevskii]